MGINGLTKYIDKNCSDCIEKLPLSAFEGQSINIDTSYFMYNFMYGARKSVIYKTSLKDILEDNIDTERIMRIWLIKFFNQIMSFVELNIVPQYILDGKCPTEKKDTHTERKQKNDDNENHITYLMDMARKNPSMEYALKDKLITRKDIPYSYRERLYEMMDIIGIPCVRADGEAEQLCAHMCLDGYSSATLSRDSDLMAYNCPIIIRKITPIKARFFGNRSKDKFEVEAIVMSNILRTLGMDHNQFLDFCVMCGTDYNSNVKGYGPVKCFNLLKKHGSIDNVNIDGKVTKNELKFDETRKLFTAPHDKIKKQYLTINKHGNIAKLVNFLFKEKGQYARNNKIHNMTTNLKKLRNSRMKNS
jgi:flap endonuclease-1